MSSASTSTTDAAPEPMDVRGHLAQNWLGFDRLPFLVKPEARPGDLFAWCWGKVVALVAVDDVAVDAENQDISAADFLAIFVHRLRPLEAVLSHAVGTLNTQQHQRETEQSTRSASMPSAREAHRKNERLNMTIENDNAALMERIDALTSAVHLMAATLGTRINRAQFIQRLGIHRNTLSKRLATDRTMPQPGPNGLWLLSEIMEWEQRR
jgi:predicted DNA-binding transcriptional regulator AlpA